MLKGIANTTLSAIAQRAPVLVAPGLALGEVLARMAAAGRGSAVIHDERGHVAGIFTQRDLVRRVDPSAPGWRDVPVAEVMTRSPAVVREDASVAQALQLMRSRHVRSLPITRDGRPVGIVSCRDLLLFVAERFPEDFLNLPPEPELEATAPWGG
ncbi:MAG: CBS domain-containing protein [Myxococcales bacterium]|nr:CBS domain-containing protein [Myxococcales bacterium]MCB9731820.1 CBS domain-containing protein [Deltaproteobacteria bacterium]